MKGLARKKPITIEFCVWDGKNVREIEEFIQNIATQNGSALIFATKEGDMEARVGDYIIKEPFDGERGFYPCKPDIFALTYDIQGRVTEDATASTGLSKPGSQVEPEY